jgi:hypothetical protein
MRALSLLSLIPLLSLALPASGQVEKGVPALQGDAPITEGFLKITPVAGDPLSKHLDVWMTLPHSPTPLRKYQVEMTKPLHMVVVSDDFKTFLHIHPVLSPNGHFLLTQKFPALGHYQVYADATPGVMNHQVFRFPLAIGDVPDNNNRNLPNTGMGVNVGPYEVDLSTVRLRSGQMEMVTVEILENGKPAKDLHPYLGSPAHAVFLNTKDLSYVHVHPMAMGMMMDMSKPMPDLPDTASVSGEMMLHIALHEAGTYKLWLQFRGANNQLYIAEFTVLAT